MSWIENAAEYLSEQKPVSTEFSIHNFEMFRKQSQTVFCDCPDQWSEVDTSVQWTWCPVSYSSSDPTNDQSIFCIRIMVPRLLSTINHTPHAHLFHLVISRFFFICVHVTILISFRITFWILNFHESVLANPWRGWTLLQIGVNAGIPNYEISNG